MLTKDQFIAQSAKQKKDGFNSWMNQPMTRALLSQIPPCETLELLLKASFEEGFGAGSAQTALSFIQEIMPKDRGPR